MKDTRPAPPATRPSRRRVLTQLPAAAASLLAPAVAGTFAAGAAHRAQAADAAPAAAGTQRAGTATGPGPDATSGTTSGNTPATASGVTPGTTSGTASGTTPGWPQRPVRVIVPFTPGGTTDNVTRLVMAEVARATGQSFVVENRPGAGTVIGVGAAAKAAPDGTTFVTVANSFCVNETLLSRRPYDGRRDLRPVALMGLSEHVLVANPASGIQRIADLKKAAQGRPRALTYASFGQGTSAHLAGEMLRTKLGLDLVHVPYKGQAPALTDVIGGAVPLMFVNWPEVRGVLQDGRLVAVGMASPQRSRFAPDIPTLAEQGVPIESNSWNGVLAPAGVPDDVVRTLNARINEAIASPAVAAQFAQDGITPKPGTPARFAEFIESEIARYAAVIRDANITIDG